MELREQVARALWFAFYWPDRDREDIEHYQHLWAESADQPHWLRAADECIRLMEWARRHDSLAGAGIAQPLTLPPADWRPTP